MTSSVYAMEVLAKQGETMLTKFHECYEEHPVERDTEFWRGKIAGWKQALAAVYGAGQAERIIQRASEAAKRPVPHSRPPARDGSGF